MSNFKDGGLLMNFDLVFLTDSFFSKMKPSEFISFLAFHIEVAMVNRIENGNESQICWMTTKYYRNPDGRFFPVGQGVESAVKFGFWIIFKKSDILFPKTYKYFCAWLPWYYGYQTTTVLLYFCCDKRQIWLFLKEIVSL